MKNPLLFQSKISDHKTTLTTAVTLRDVFAAFAINGLLERGIANREVPELAYALADGMLKAREPKKETKQTVERVVTKRLQHTQDWIAACPFCKAEIRVYSGEDALGMRPHNCDHAVAIEENGSFMEVVFLKET